MLYRLSYASRRKLTIILIGRQIARKTARFFSGPRHKRPLAPTSHLEPVRAISPKPLICLSFHKLESKSTRRPIGT